MTVEQGIALGLLCGVTVSGWCYALYWRNECRKVLAQVNRILDARHADWERKHVAARGSPADPDTPLTAIED